MGLLVPSGLSVLLGWKALEAAGMLVLAFLDDGESGISGAGRVSLVGKPALSEDSAR